MRTTQTLPLYLITLSFLLAPLYLTGCEYNIIDSEPNTTPRHIAPKPVIASQAPASTTTSQPQKAFQAPMNCAATVMRPARFRTIQRKVLVFEGSYEFTNHPSEIKTRTIRIQTHPARYVQETTPAVYRTVTEKIPVSRQRSELYAKPAQYRTSEREYTLKPRYIRWKTGCLPITSPNANDTDPNTTAKQCMEIVPARRQIVKSEVIDVPPQTLKRTFDTEYLAVERKVLVKAGRGTGIIPAQYQDIEVQYVANPWSINSTPTPSRYETLSTEVLLNPSQQISMPSLCETLMTARDIQILQQALQNKGEEKLIITGKMDTATRIAITQFQQKQQLVQGAITLETLRALGF